MPTRFTVSSPSLGHTSGYADLHVLQQLAAARGSTKKPKALLQRKPRHLEPVQVTNQQQQQYDGLGFVAGRQQPHLLDAEERSISSKQLRSLVSSAVLMEKPTLKSASDGYTYSARPQQRTSNHERSRVADPVLSKLDAQRYGSGAATTAKPSSASVKERRQGDEEEYESPRSRKHHHVAHVRSLQTPEQQNTITKTHHGVCVVVQDTPSNQTRMQSLDLRSMHGTTLARYRRLVGTVARKNLIQILHKASQNVAFSRLQHRCASRIQGAVWGFLQQRRERRRRRDLSALIVQCKWRNCQARSTFAILQSDRDRRVRLQSLVNLREKRSAIRIQQTYRAHSERKSRIARREWAWARLAAMWRSKTHKQRKGMLAEQDLSSVSSENEHAEQLCGGKQRSGLTQRHEASSAASDPDSLPLQTVASGEDGGTFCHEAQVLNQVVSSVSATEDLWAPRRQQGEESVGTLGLSVDSESSTALATAESASNLGHERGVGHVLNAEKCSPTSVLTEDDSVGATQDASDSAPECNEDFAHLSFSQSAAACEREAMSSLRKMPSDIVPSSSVEAASSASNTSSLDELCVVISNTPPPSPRAAAKAHCAERVLSRFLAVWITRSLERIRRERQAQRRACVQLQSRARQWIAANRVRFVRQLAIRVQQAELQNAWLSDVRFLQSTLAVVEETRSDGEQSSDDDDEDGPSFSVPASVTWSGATGCHAFLPTRNGEIPPGVPRRELGATSLWRWSWSTEAWTAS